MSTYSCPLRQADLDIARWFSAEVCDRAACEDAGLRVCLCTVGMMRCVMKTNELLSILRASLWLRVHGREAEEVESTGVDVGG